MDPEHCLLFLKSHLSGTIYLLIIATWFSTLFMTQGIESLRELPIGLGMGLLNMSFILSSRSSLLESRM